MILEMMMSSTEQEGYETTVEDLRFRGQQQSENDDFVVKTHEDDVMKMRMQNFDDDAALEKHVERARQLLAAQNESRMQSENRRFEEYLHNPNSQDITKKFHREE